MQYSELSILFIAIVAGTFLAALVIVLSAIVAGTGRRPSARGVVSFFNAIVWSMSGVAVLSFFAYFLYLGLQGPRAGSPGTREFADSGDRIVQGPVNHPRERRRRAAEREARAAYRQNQGHDLADSGAARSSDPVSAKLTETSGSEVAETDVPAVAVTQQEIVSAEADTANQPSWLTRKSETIANPNLAVVSSKEYVDRNDAYNEAMALTVRQIKRRFEHLHRSGEPWNVPSQLARDRIVTTEYTEVQSHDFGSVVSDMYRVHLLLDVSPDTLRQLYPAWREQIVARRLWSLGFLLALATVMLASLAGYFRLDRLTQGRYRGRLKLAAVLVVAGTCTLGLITA